jgi:endonuclease/exonuclease/phosphatase (EEP) superfamily protein YafD
MAGQPGKTWRILAGFYAAVLAGLTLLNRIGAEHWWFGTLNLYLPQAIWTVPALLLLPAVRAGRGWIWVPALGLAWALGPVMGFHWSAQTQPPSGAGPALRVMTCNIKNGMRDSAELGREIDRFRPEVVLLQDADGLFASRFGAYFRDWQVQAHGQYVTASRLPLGPAEVLSVPASSGVQPILRSQVVVGGTVLTIYNVHLLSPRDSLNAFRKVDRGNWDLPGAIRELEQSAAVRLDQARALGELVRKESGPVLIAGDLNSPDGSRACAALLAAGLHDAFSEGGRGYGYTYGHFLLRRWVPWLRLSWMRIDHFMLSARLRAWRCWVGTARASDHRPVIADLVLEPGRAGL